MNQSNSPAFYSQPLNSNNPPSILQPQSVNSIQQPHSVNSLQQPHSVSSIQQPHSVSNIQQPHSVSNLQQPHSVNSLTAAQSVAPPVGPSHTVNIDFANSTTNFNQFDLNSLVSTFQYEFGNDDIPEPVIRSKELLNQLKLSIQSLLSQLSFILNPANEQSKQQVDNQFQLLGKQIENFYKTCDLLTVSLRSACEAQLLSNEMRQLYRYYAHMDHTDVARNEGQMVNSMNIQMQRINELKGILKRFLTFKEQEVVLQPPTPPPQLSQPGPAQMQMPFNLQQQQQPQNQSPMPQQQPQQMPAGQPQQQQNYYQQQMY